MALTGTVRLAGWWYGAALLALAIAYFCAAKVGLSLAVVSAQVSPVWPPTGLALAAVVLLGYRAWPGIAAGALLANLGSGAPLVVAAGIATGNTLEALVGAWLLRRMWFEPAMERPRHVVALAVGGAGLSTMIAATVGVTSLCLGRVHAWEQFGTLWWTWWIGDAMGDLVLAPALLVWASGEGRPARRVWGEVGAFCVALGAAGQLIFFALPGAELTYLVAPLFAWSALRLGQAVTATAVVVVASLAVLASITQLASRADSSFNEHLLLLQTFMGTMAVASLVLGAATAQRWRAEESLRGSEARLRLALESGRMGTWEWDIRSGRVTWSAGLEEIHGMAPGAFPGTIAAVVEGAVPEDRERVRESVARALERRAEHQVEYRIMLAGGQVRWLEGRGRVVLGPDGAPAQMIGLCMDVTERKRAEQALARSNADLEDFAHVASHDLKEPLRGIMHSVSFLLSDYGAKLDEEGRRRLETLRALSEQLGRQISALLEFSRVGRTELAVEDVDLNELVRVALAPLALRLQEEGAEVRVVGRLPRVRCDRVRVAQVFANLVGNALKYNESRAKLVEIGAAAGAGAAVLYVKDNGIGIAARDREGVFRLFTRLAGRERYGGGSGAGLAIVKSIVERHGGRVWLESEAGRGTTFYFTLGAGAEGGGIVAPEGAGAVVG